VVRERDCNDGDALNLEWRRCEGLPLDSVQGREHPRRGRLISTGVWLLGSAASSETPLDSEMPPPSSVPSREVLRDGAKPLTLRLSGLWL
jgi:hypothetical protein